MNEYILKSAALGSSTSNVVMLNALKLFNSRKEAIYYGYCGKTKRRIGRSSNRQIQKTGIGFGNPPGGA